MKGKNFANGLLIVQVICMARTIPYKVTSLTVEGEEVGSIWFVEVVIAVSVYNIGHVRECICCQ